MKILSELYNSGTETFRKTLYTAHCLLKIILEKESLNIGLKGEYSTWSANDKLYEEMKTLNFVKTLHLLFVIPEPLVERRRGNLEEIYLQAFVAVTGLGCQHSSLSSPSRINNTNTTTTRPVSLPEVPRLCICIYKCADQCSL